MPILPDMSALDPNVSSATCPICGKRSEQMFRPFCSRRCADIDLNRWLSGVYAVPVEDDSDEDGARPPEREADKPA